MSKLREKVAKVSNAYKSTWFCYDLYINTTTTTIKYCLIDEAGYMDQNVSLKIRNIEKLLIKFFFKR